MKFFKIEEISQEAYESYMGEVNPMHSQEYENIDGTVYLAINEDDEYEISVDLDVFE